MTEQITLSLSRGFWGIHTWKPLNIKHGFQICCTALASKWLRFWVNHQHSESCHRYFLKCEWRFHCFWKFHFFGSDCQELKYYQVSKITSRGRIENGTQVEQSAKLKIVWMETGIQMPEESFSTNSLGFPGGSDSKESACNAGDPGSILGSGRCPGEENGYSLQHSCLENSTDREPWRATIHAESPTWLSDWHTHVFLSLSLSLWLRKTKFEDMLPWSPGRLSSWAEDLPSTFRMGSKKVKEKGFTNSYHHPPGR